MSFSPAPFFRILAQTQAVTQEICTEGSQYVCSFLPRIFPLLLIDYCFWFWLLWSEVAQSCETLCDPMNCIPTRLLCPWNFLGKSAGVGCHFLLQGIFLNWGLNPGLVHCRQTLYPLSSQGSPDFFNSGKWNGDLSDRGQRCITWFHC